MMKNRRYSELIRLNTFEERYDYLKLTGVIGERTFGGNRYLNQRFYTSKDWRDFRSRIVVRDGGCDLACPDRPLYSDTHPDANQRLVVHHLNPLDEKRILAGDFSEALDPENAILTSANTHKAIHYGDKSLLILEPTVRTPYDTCPWKENR